MSAVGWVGNGSKLGGGQRGRGSGPLGRGRPEGGPTEES